MFLTLTHDNNKKIVITVFFTVLLFAGLFTFKDHGMAGDEIVSRNNGLVSYRYVTEGNRELFSYRDRYYGTAFEMALVAAEDLAGLEDTRHIFLMRRLLNFLLFYAGVIFFYLIISYSFGNWKYALLGSVFLAASPRIFAHAFFNSKDVGFMSVFIIGIYTLIRYLDQKTLSRVLSHALVSAILVGIRVIGIILPVITALFVVLGLFAAKKEKRSTALVSLFAYGGIFVLFTVFFWPFLWEAPVRNFVDAFSQMRAFPWDGDVLYFGEYVRSTALPWHYIPAWIAITTPPGYTLLFVIGALSIIRSFASNPVKAYTSRKHEIVFLALFILPIAAVIALKSVLYDGWRHMFFVYPAFLLVSVSGVKTLMDFMKRSARTGFLFPARCLLVCVIALIAGMPLYFMVRWHPYQNVYFNVLSGGMDNVRQNFEMDYWGISYKECLEYIAASDDRDNIKVYVTTLKGRIGRIPALILRREDRERFSFTSSPADADYVIGNYRWHPDDYPFPNEVYSVNVNGAKIAAVHKLR
jgi:hypothetical protein